MPNNRKVINFLKECMADALIELMETKEFSKIRVNEIAKLAGVNRSTWFRGFNDKSNALTFKLVQLWYRRAEERGLSERNRYTIENAEDFFGFCYENRELVALMIKSGQQTAVYEAFYEIMAPQFNTDPGTCYESRFYSYGLFGLLGEWNRREYKESPEEMVKIFNRIIIEPNTISDSIPRQ